MKGHNSNSVRFRGSMSNFINYFFPGFGNRHLKSISALFLIFLTLFIILEWTSNKREDEIVRLRGEIELLKRKLRVEDASLPVIYLITPTYYRPVQKAELTRLCHTFLLVQNIHWIVVEDSEKKTKLVTNFLSSCGVPYTHLNRLTPLEEKLKEKDPHWMKPRGVRQRNEALEWLRSSGGAGNAVIYFADDDNTYSLELFEEIRAVRRVGVWPVGLVGGLMVEKPKLNKAGKVEGWDVVWSPKRPFAIDMAGFAINYRHWLDRPEAKFAFKVKRGHQESEFLKHLVTSLEELEPKAEMCTKVLVWHTRTEKVKLAEEAKLKSLLLPPSNAGIEV